MYVVEDKFMQGSYSIRYRPGSPYYKYRWDVTVYPDDRGGFPNGADGYARSIKHAIRQICRFLADWEVDGRDYK